MKSNAKRHEPRAGERVKPLVRAGSIDVGGVRHRNGVPAGLVAQRRDVGLELTPATKRLAAFNAVQNTYLSTFQILGGLGLVLGSVGLGLVVMRNVFERRGELGMFYWVEGSTGYALVGSLSRDELLKLAEAIYKQVQS